MKKKHPFHGKRGKYFWYNLMIGIELIMYLALTSAIFWVQDKISLLHSKPNVSTSTDKPPSSGTIADKSLEYAHIEKETHLKNTLVANPNDLQANQNLAQLYYQQGKWEKTLAQYQKILTLNPKDVETHLALAQLFLSSPAHTSQAIEHLRKVLALEPAHPKRKNIELWLSELAKQEIQAKEKLILRWQKLLAQTQEESKRQGLALRIAQLEKQLTHDRASTVGKK
jgi:tetratricopeptide (TPR) repeat protein